MRFGARLRALVPALALGAAALGAAALGGCRADTSLTNPNTQTVESFWKTEADAAQGITATYNSLNFIGTYLRWFPFYYDVRSDLGYSLSPAIELANQSKFVFTNYNYEIPRSAWFDSYTSVSRANQVIAYVPNIAMDATRRDRYVGEAKFIRALDYFRLITLYGPDIPLVTQPSQAQDRPGPAGEPALWAQMEKDLTEAAATLPKVPFRENGGHAVAASAQSVLGRVYLQERKWQQAADALAPVVNGQTGTYSLAPDYAALFTPAGNNSSEAIFENQFGDPTTVASGIYGLNSGRFLGPCGPAFCDSYPTRWYFNEFLRDSTTDGKVDPRAEATIFWYHGPDTPVHGLTWTQRGYADTTRLFWRKWTEYYPAGSTDISWDAPINVKIVRLADVYLMYAEALNETGKTAEAAQYVNQVRARVRLRPVAAADQAAMREAILRERALELGLEGSRWNDLLRQNRLTTAYLPTLIEHDDEFKSFVTGKSERFPIPTDEINLNPNLKQNPGW